MLIHRSSAIASVLGDHKRQMLRELMGVDMLLLDSKVFIIVNSCQDGSHFEPRPVSPPIPNKCDWETEPAEVDFPNSAMIGKVFSRFTFSFSFVLVLLREARLRDRSVAAKKSTAAGGLKSVLKNPTGSKSSGSSFEDDDEVGDWGYVVRQHQRVEDVDLSGGEGSSCRDLARSIMKLGELYERIEGAKQRMMIELDTPMMEAAQELEL
ncbi:hypothetical protein HID58_087426 [Brassica napus]|uniref:Uncharacterized protein n=1 Tax=Brassica napus TaxID=3708 RepID=A0ABQ7XT96_BRANA|nr:hypothetical protein HID58_087426 [Brassica napus]